VLRSAVGAGLVEDELCAEVGGVHVDRHDVVGGDVVGEDAGRHGHAGLAHQRLDRPRALEGRQDRLVRLRAGPAVEFGHRVLGVQRGDCLAVAPVAAANVTRQDLDHLAPLFRFHIHFSVLQIFALLRELKLQL
jgi:hypothetical protein